MQKSTQRTVIGATNRLSATFRVLVLAAGVLVPSGLSFAAPIVPGFDSNSLGRRDDGSSGLVNIGFNINYYGLMSSIVSVSNNGYINIGGDMGWCCAQALSNTYVRTIAPFFVDIDTRAAATTPVSYGQGTYNGRLAFGANWVDVGRYYMGTELNSFQLILVDRSDTGLGNFDAIFNYNTLRFDTGAHTGFSDGAGWAYELAGSGEGQLYNGGINSLIAGSYDSPTLGQYVFAIRDGQLLASQVPEPSTALMLGSGILVFGLGLYRRRRSK